MLKESEEIVEVASRVIKIGSPWRGFSGITEIVAPYVSPGTRKDVMRRVLRRGFIPLVYSSYVRKRRPKAILPASPTGKNRLFII